MKLTISYFHSIIGFYLKYLLWLFLLCIIQGGRLTAEELRVTSSNLISFKPLLRTADRLLVEKGEREIFLREGITSKSSIRSIMTEASSDKRTDNLNTDLGEIKENYKSNTNPQSSYELDFSLKLFLLGKEIIGKIYLIHGEGSPPIYSIQIGAPTGGGPLNGKGQYIFWIEGDKSFSVLSPISGRCREIPWEGIGDPILSSGLSLDQIFFSYGPESLFKISALERIEQLVPETLKLDQDSLDKVTNLDLSKDRFVIKNLLRHKVSSISNLFRRSVSVLDSDPTTGLPYQMQYEIETPNRARAIINYSWLKLSSNLFYPKSIEYFESKNDLLLVSRLEITSLRASSNSRSQFLENMTKLCRETKE